MSCDDCDKPSYTKGPDGELCRDCYGDRANFTARSAWSRANVLSYFAENFGAFYRATWTPEQLARFEREKPIRAAHRMKILENLAAYKRGEFLPHWSLVRGVRDIDRCKRCREVTVVEEIALRCGCIRKFCEPCRTRPAHGDYLSFDEWCDAYAYMHQYEGGAWVSGHNGRLVEIDFGTNRQTFFLWTVEIRTVCGSSPAKTKRYVRPALAQHLQSLFGCPLRSHWSRYQESARRAQQRGAP